MNDIDTLMTRVQEINSKLAHELTLEDTDTLITYHRCQRARRASGEKIEKPKVDLASILNIPISKPQSKPMFTRKL